MKQAGGGGELGRKVGATFFFLSFFFLFSFLFHVPFPVPNPFQDSRPPLGCSSP